MQGIGPTLTPFPELMWGTGVPLPAWFPTSSLEPPVGHFVGSVHRIGRQVERLHSDPGGHKAGDGRLSMLGSDRCPPLGSDQCPSLGSDQCPSLGSDQCPSLGSDRCPSLGARFRWNARWIV